MASRILIRRLLSSSKLPFLIQILQPLLKLLLLLIKCMALIIGILNEVFHLLPFPCLLVRRGMLLGVPICPYLLSFVPICTYSMYYLYLLVPTCSTPPTGHRRLFYSIAIYWFGIRNRYSFTLSYWVSFGFSWKDLIAWFKITFLNDVQALFIIHPRVWDHDLLLHAMLCYSTLCYAILLLYYSPRPLVCCYWFDFIRLLFFQ